MDGWALLDLLKHDPRTRHVPIHVISVDDQKKRGLGPAPSASSRSRSSGMP
jgi:CheY-like chemotaxis protein